MRLAMVSRPTVYHIYIIFIATLGPLQFGYHLVVVLLHKRLYPELTSSRANSMPLIELSPAKMTYFQVPHPTSPNAYP
jgi:hypothetical protein